MTDARDRPPRARARPRGKSLLTLNLDNPYTRLGISPTASTREIAERIDARRGEANKRLKAKAAALPDDPDEAEILELDAIHHVIGDDRNRDKYDERHPQDSLLTVQPSGASRVWQRHGRAGLVSDWIAEISGDDALLPTPRCVRLWAPAGLEKELLELLAHFSPSSDRDGRPAEANAPLSIEDLDSLREGN